MSEPLRILIVEDNRLDAELVELALRRAGLEFESLHVAVRGELDAAITRFEPAVILSDFSFPDMTGLEVVRIARALAPLTPTIIVTGTLDEETAVDCIKQGAADYVLKERLARLGPAVRGALEARRVREAHDRAQAALRDSEEKYRIVCETATDAILTIDHDGSVRFANHAAEAIFGWPAAELVGRPLAVLMSESLRGEFLRAFPQRGEADDSPLPRREMRLPGLHRDGHEIPLEISFGPFRRGSRLWYTGVVRDVTERDRAEQAAHRLVAIVESSADVIHSTTLDGLITSWNPAAESTYGWSAAEAIGRSISIVVPPERATEVAWILDVIRRGDRVERFETVRVRRDGSRLDVSLSIAPIRDGGGRVVGASTIARDISDRKRAEQALRASEERYALAARGANDGLWDWDLLRGEIYFSPRWAEMLGLAEGELGGSPAEWISRVHPDDTKLVKAEMSSHLEGSSSKFQCEYRILHKDGSWRWMLCRGLAVRDATGRATRFVGSQTEITEQRLVEEKLSFDALHDSLTGLPNRTLFMDRLERLVQRARREPDEHYSVLFLDLDRFKFVNDSLGHMAGDRLLVEVGRRIARCIRPGDTVARVGGDEFAVLVEDTADVDAAILVANRIQREVAASFDIGGHVVFTTASIGIASSSSRYECGDDVLRDADTAMYRAKDLGKARYELFDTAMHRRVVARLQLETDLRKAVDSGEFQVDYQPIVELGRDRIVGFEALVRWHHPVRGVVFPSEFIPVAEETGLIVPIGQWVVETACRQLEKWQRDFRRDPPLEISINLSGRQLLHPGLIDDLATVIDRLELAAHSVKFEITESVLMEEGATASGVLRQLKARRHLLALDNFGTGFSSLSYLHRFPIDTLKIDQSFVSRLGVRNDGAHADGNGGGSGAEDGHEIVRTILLLASGLGMKVVAEGVETAEQLALLRKLECGHAQGYFFSRPVDVASAGKLLTKGAGG